MDNKFNRGHRGRDRMAVRLSTISAITNAVVSSNHVHGEVYLIQQYVIKFVSDLRQVGGILWLLRFPPPIKVTATI